LLVEFPLQFIHHVFDRVRKSQLGGSETMSILISHIATPIYQDLDRVHETICRTEVQRSIALRIKNIGIGAKVAQEGNESPITSLGGNVKWCFAGSIWPIQHEREQGDV